MFGCAYIFSLFMYIYSGVRTCIYTYILICPVIILGVWSMGVKCKRMENEAGNK